MKCDWCGEDVMLDEESQGLLPCAGPYHRECWLRFIVGSVGHQRGLCSCPGKPGTLDDPPHMTRREAARAALEEFERAKG